MSIPHWFTAVWISAVPNRIIRITWWIFAIPQRSIRRRNLLQTQTACAGDIRPVAKRPCWWVAPCCTSRHSCEGLAQCPAADPLFGRDIEAQAAAMAGRIFTGSWQKSTRFRRAYPSQSLPASESCAGGLSRQWHHAHRLARRQDGLIRDRLERVPGGATGDMSA